MPLTPAQKQKRYRDKLQRENPEKYAEMKKKTAECALRYYRKKTSQCTEQDKEEKRQKWRAERKTLKQAQHDKVRIDLSDDKNVEKEQMSKLRKENHGLKREIITLRKRFEAIRKIHYRKSKKFNEVNKAFQEIKEKYQQIKLKEQDCTKNELLGIYINIYENKKTKDCEESCKPDLSITVKGNKNEKAH